MSNNPRFKPGKECGYDVVRDQGRTVLAMMPNTAKPNSTRYMAEICAKALNDADERSRGE